MANRERGEVDLRLGGQTYTLRLSLNSLCLLEEHFSTPEATVTFQQIAQRLGDVRMGDLRRVLWTALQEHHAEAAPTEAEAGALIAVQDMSVILKALQALLAPDAADVRELVPARPRTAQGTSGVGAKRSSAPAKSA
jgi:hypothetical protein